MLTSMPPVQDAISLRPITPPDATGFPSITSRKDAADADILVSEAIYVISTERAALTHLENVYRTDQLAREHLTRAVNQIARSVKIGGKLVVCGVGKSGKIGKKVEATMNSFGIHSSFLHPTEALHGDLGIIRPDDTLLLISFSGRTPELLLLLPHIPPTVSVIAITSHSHPSTCPLLSYQAPELGILLPAPIHENEELSFGVCAPTSSTTVALALGDALAITAARKLHTLPGRGPAEVFKGFHPGGAIGAASALSTPNSMSASSMSFFSSPSSASPTASDYLQSRPILQPPPQQQQQQQQQQNPPSLHSTSLPNPDHVSVRKSFITDSNAFVPFKYIPTVSPPSNRRLRLLDILLTAIQHPDAKSWVFLSGNTDIINPRRVRLLLQHTRHADPDTHRDNTDTDADTRVSELADCNNASLAVNRRNWFCVPSSSTISDVRRCLLSLGSKSKSESVDVIAVIMSDGDKDKEKGKNKDKDRGHGRDMDDTDDNDVFGFGLDFDLGSCLGFIEVMDL